MERSAQPAPPVGRGHLRRHMHTLAAIKVTAPMLGLLGTLLGLINALAGMAMTGVADLRAVGAGMSEALLMTVLGLLVGLPAWWAHAFFASWAERIQAHAGGVAPRCRAARPSGRLDGPARGGGAWPSWHRSTSRPPTAHQQFVRRFPSLGKAWDLVNEEGDAGPLDAKTQRLLKLAIAIGAMSEGAVHSGVRKARDAGASLAEMEQVVALAASTIGFPASVAVWRWVREEASGARRPTKRRR